jgi:hypothetical protein
MSVRWCPGFAAFQVIRCEFCNVVKTTRAFSANERRSIRLVAKCEDGCGRVQNLASRARWQAELRGEAPTLRSDRFRTVRTQSDFAAPTVAKLWRRQLCACPTSRTRQTQLVPGASRSGGLQPPTTEPSRQVTGDRRRDCRLGNRGSGTATAVIAERELWDRRSAN